MVDADSKNFLFPMNLQYWCCLPEVYVPGGRQLLFLAQVQDVS